MSKRHLYPRGLAIMLGLGAGWLPFSRVAGSNRQRRGWNTPHQGEREKLRRRVGGFHSVRQQGGLVELQRGRYVIVTPAAEEAARSFVTVTREDLARVDA